jgi:hydrogenase expression/formation protein HypD
MNNFISFLQKELRDKEQIRTIFDQMLKDYSSVAKNYDQILIMHVCGTHEDTLMKNGLRYLLEKEFPKLKLVAGPGCPVCVSPVFDIDIAVHLADNVKNSIITSYGDMIRVPGSKGSLERSRQKGAKVITVYSVMDAVKMAKEQPDKNVIFISPGFETTAPTTALELSNIPPENFNVLSSHRLVPPALDVLMSIPGFNIKGFIMPGHVSVIVGSDYYQDFFDKYHIPSAISGFEPYDMITGLASILNQLANQKPEIKNAYTRVVTKEGNKIAKKAIADVFDVVDANWRGLGTFKNSGLDLSKKFSSWNSRLIYEDLIETIPIPEKETPNGCSCPDVVIGRKDPEECVLFLNGCSPEQPIGPCMVGLEGTCRIRAIYS